MVSIRLRVTHFCNFVQHQRKRYLFSLSPFYLLLMLNNFYWLAILFRLVDLFVIYKVVKTLLFCHFCFPIAWVRSRSGLIKGLSTSSHRLALAQRINNGQITWIFNSLLSLTFFGRFFSFPFRFHIVIWGACLPYLRLFLLNGLAFRVIHLNTIIDFFWVWLIGVVVHCNDLVFCNGLLLLF